MVRFPRWSWKRWLLAAGALLVLYLVALSAIPALLNDDESGPTVEPERAQRAIQAENWALVEPDDRTALAVAVDAAWRNLSSYRFSYRAGTPDELAAAQPRVATESVFALDRRGFITQQHDTNFTAANAPGGVGVDQRFDGYRVRTDEAYVNNRGRKLGEAELIYQRGTGPWTCQRVLADRNPPPVPGLLLAEGGDAGITEIDGHRVRGFHLPAGAFGLRWPATVWIDMDRLLIRRQEIESAVPGQHEVWTYTDFDEPVQISPPSDVACVDG